MVTVSAVSNTHGVVGSVMLPVFINGTVTPPCSALATITPPATPINSFMSTTWNTPYTIVYDPFTTSDPNCDITVTFSALYLEEKYLSSFDPVTRTIVLLFDDKDLFMNKTVTFTLYGYLENSR